MNHNTADIATTGLTKTTRLQEKPTGKEIWVKSDV